MGADREEAGATRRLVAGGKVVGSAGLRALEGDWVGPAGFYTVNEGSGSMGPA